MRVARRVVDEPHGRHRGLDRYAAVDPCGRVRQLRGDGRPGLVGVVAVGRETRDAGRLAGGDDGADLGAVAREHDEDVRHVLRHEAGDEP
ncbi:MAG: hypothetical protein ABW024_07765, partial [Microbacterium sp.]